MEGKRIDKDFISFLQAENLPHVDLMAEHALDFKQHNMEIEEYIDKYFIGHYSPLGNFFCAYALKDRITAMLDPKPFPYQ